MKTIRILGTMIAALAIALGTAHAQDYPTQTIKLIVPFTPGGPVDALGRVVTQYLQKRIGQNIIIENRSGGGTSIGAKAVASAPPDGYTLLLVGPNLAYYPVLFPNLDFDPAKGLVPVATVVTWSHVFAVAPSVPAKSVPELVAYAKANPGKVNMASGGIGTSPHLCGELFQIQTQTKMVHVPYRGNYMTDLLANQVQVVFNPIAQALPLIRDGKLRAYGVTTAYRIKALPDVPAIGEVVKGYDAIGWYGLGAPSKTPPEIIKKLSEAMNAAIAVPAVMERFVQLGVEPMPLTPEGFKKHIAVEAEKWGKVIKAQDIKIN